MSPTLPKVQLYDYGLAYYPARARVMLLEKGFDASSIVNTDILQCKNLTQEFMKKSKGTGIDQRRHKRLLLTCTHNTKAHYLFLRFTTRAAPKW